MKSIKNLKRGAAILLCAAMLLGDSTMLYATELSENAVAGNVIVEATADELDAEQEVAPEVEAAEPETAPEAETIEAGAEVVAEVAAESEPVVEEAAPEAEAVAAEAEPEAGADAEEVAEDDAEEENSDAEVEEGENAEAAENDDAEVEAEEEKEEEEKVELPTSFEASVDDATVTVIVEEGTFSEPVTLQVSKMEITDEIQAKLDEQAIAEKKSIESATAYDISFINEAGAEVEPAKQVQVSIATNVVEAGADVSVYHFDEETSEVADVSAVVDEVGDVAFGASEFSPYIIVNNGGDRITVKMHHVDDKNKELCATDEWSLPVGDSVTDYNKAQNWDVVRVTKGSIDGQPIYEKETNEVNPLIFVSDTEVWVHYKPIVIDEKDASVKFWDYTVQPLFSNGYIRPSDSINRIENYFGNYSSYLTVGKQEDGNGGGRTCEEHAKNRNREGLQYYDGHRYNQYDEKTPKTGIVNSITNEGLGDVVFNVNQPGVFVEAETTGRKFYTDYKLVFNQVGDTFTLIGVKDPKGNRVWTKSGEEGNNFFPLDTIPGTINGDNANNEASRDNGGDGNKHNDFFGMRYDVNFQLGDYTGDLSYTFHGDDDLWVLLDGQVVQELDIGGIHKAIPRDNIDLKKYIDLNDKEKMHHLTVLYMERGAGESNCTMKFTLPHAQIIDHNTPTADLTFEKVDAADKNVKLAGATFVLERKDMEGYKRQATSNNNGVVSFNGLIEGTYKLRETKAPDGYKLEEDIFWTVEVSFKKDADGNATTTSVILKDKDGNAVADNQIPNTSNKVEEYDKNAIVDNEEARTFQINLSATFTGTETTIIPGTVTGGDGSVVLVLDASSSMTNKVTSYVKETESGELAAIASKIDLSKGEHYVKLTGTGKDSPYFRLGKKIDTTQKTINRKTVTFRYYTASNGKNYYYDVERHFWKKNATDTVAASGISDDGFIYKKDTSKTRLDVLKEATKALINALPDGAKITIITFNSDAQLLGNYGSNNYITISATTRTALNQAIDNLSTGSGTRASTGFAKARTILKDQSGKKYVVFFTDGDDKDKENSKSEANELKKLATIYAVGVAEAHADFLKACDSNNSPRLNADITGLSAIFQKLGETISEDITQTTTTAETGIVRDIVDQRFDLLADDKTTKITVSGTYTIGGKDATVTINNDGTTTIDWTNQELDEWSVSFYVKAKENFLGGNRVPTNTSASGVYIGTTVTPFPQPTVNVPLLSLAGSETEETVFLGENIAAGAFVATLLGQITNLPTISWSDSPIPYSYGNDNDTFGEITLTRSAEGDGAAWTGHSADYIGSPAERYTLTASYRPYTYEERLDANSELEGMLDPQGTYRTDAVSATAAHKVNVVAGTIKLTKNIKKKDFKESYGDPVFTFKIANGTDTYYKTVRFNRDVIDQAKQDIVTLSADIVGLPAGEYTIEELPTMGFEFVELTLGLDGADAKKVDGKVASFTFGSKANKDAKATFTNTMKHSKHDTDTDVVKNHFHIEKDNNGIDKITTVDNGGSQDVGTYKSLTNN